jgi:Ni,Fe-hydrogenase I small subunit
MNAGLAAPAVAAAAIAAVVINAVAKQKMAKKMWSMDQCSRPVIRVPVPESWSCPRRLGYDENRLELEHLARIRPSLTLM